MHYLRGNIASAHGIIILPTSFACYILQLLAYELCKLVVMVVNVNIFYGTGSECKVMFCYAFC